VTLDQLRTFRAVARLQSFTRAAESLRLTQPAVSAQIVALEGRLKARLFDRIGKRIVLTEAGRIVLDGAEAILRQVAEMRQSLDDLEGLRRGTLTLGASLVVGIYLLPEILGRFKKQYPQVEVRLRIEYARKIIEEVAISAIDLGIVGEGLPVTDSRLVVKPFRKDELVVIVSARHPWASRRRISPAELAREPFIIPENTLATSEIVLRQLGAAGIRLNTVMELGNIEAVKKAVEANLGVSIMSQCAISGEVAARQLTALRVAGVTLQRDMSVVWRKDQHLSRATEAFLAIFAEEAASARRRSPRG
jgi:DNA-binding transcriptional LysR family regulator